MYLKLALRSWLILAGVLALSLHSAVAQIVPDGTLPNNSSVTTQDNLRTITDGTQAGTNLFHSFQEFSVPTGNTAYFNNSLDVQNIITRVTGKSISNIDGILKANGTANLFLINPNGIVFGQNARVDIGGSFVGSTANSLKFLDGFEFSATDPQVVPLLTISVPIGLQFGQNPGAIKVRGTGYDLSVQNPIITSPITRGSRSTGLRVSPGKTLALVGGDVDLRGGTLTAEQGRIELGSVGSGQVNLSPIPQGFALSYGGVQSGHYIRLSQQALADASGGGSIQVQGNNVSLSDGSLILIQNQREQRGGSVSVNAASLEISGISPDGRLKGGLRTETVGSGSGADIAISTKQLLIQDGAGITTRSNSPARGGNITVNATESVQLSGFSPINPTFTGSIAAGSASFGDTGDVTVTTKRLAALNGGGISSVTYGSSKAGNVTVNATESVELIGMSSRFLGSYVNATTLNVGDAGELTINTSRLIVRNGGNVQSSTFASGNAGSVTINATESVEVTGTVPGALNPSFIGAGANLANESTRQLYQIPPVLSGFSGNITINTNNLSVTNSARVQVSNQGVGNAGTLQVNARSIFLDSEGGITATTKSGNGGNITLGIKDLLLLRRGSQISTTAGAAKVGGNGGNININTPNGFLVTVPGENSDISANSEESFGGRVIVNASGIFGSQFREQPTDNSDITASSALGSQFNGTVTLNTPDIDPSQSLTELPTNLVDTSGLIANSCIGRSNQILGKFIIIGNGGLPVMPDDPLVASYQTYQLPTVHSASVSTLQENAQDSEDTNSSKPHNSSTSAPIVEAKGWIYTPNGEVILTADAPIVTPNSSRFQVPTCLGS